MKAFNIKALFSVMILIFSTGFILAGCDSSDSDDGDSGGTKTLAITVPSGEIKYVDLADGTVNDGSGGVSGSVSWDIAFENARIIYTNSGATAALLTSGGGGGVWFTGETDIDAVDTAEGASFAGTYNTDIIRSIDYAGAMGLGVVEKRLNVMTYVGYDNESTGADGSSGNPFSATFLYDKDQFYDSAGMGAYTVNNRVYIIRHGDGSSCSAVQISGLEGDTTERIYEIKYKSLD